MPKSARSLIVIAGIDAVTQKVLYQTQFLVQRGFRFTILTTNRADGSISADPSADITLIPANPFARFRQFIRLIHSERDRLHHVELYVGGRFAFVYALLSRLWRVPLLVVERGDLYYCIHRRYPLSMRLSIYACYRLAHLIWAKELYMDRWFAERGITERFLLPNAVPIPDTTPERARDLEFLWVNRLVPERHPDWFASALASLSDGRPIAAAVLGVMQRTSDATASMQAGVAERLTALGGVEVLGFVPPEDHYDRARFFVLPAEMVFCNFSLLEAMSRGVVPIVSDVEGSDRIVDDGVNGFLARHSPEGLEESMRHALSLDEASWKSMSAAARRTVEERFGIGAWGGELERRYEGLNGPPA